MKIIFVNRAMSMFRGGAENFDLNLARGLRRLGCEVEFITSRPLIKNIQYPLSEFSTDYVYSPWLYNFAHKFSRNSLIGKIPYLRGLPSLLNIISFSISAFRIIKRKKFDVAQLNGLPLLGSWIVKYLNKVAVVRFPGPPSRFYYSQMMQCSALVANGDAYNYIIKQIGINCHNIPPGVDDKVFRRIGGSSVRERYNVSNQDFLLLYVGRFIEIKNIPFLLEGFAQACREQNNLTLMLVGEGYLLHEMQQLASKHGIIEKVRFVGGMEQKQLPSYYSAADAFIITSHYDNFPNAVLEAMACGLPIIGTNVGGIPQQIADGENGFLIEPGNLLDLKMAILNLAKNSEKCQVMGRKNLFLVKNSYNWRVTCEKFLQVYREIVVRNSNR